MIKWLVFLAILQSLVIISNTQDAADADLTMMEIIAKYGYYPEEHEVETEDGYLLTVYRMYKKDALNSSLTPVMLVHGLMGSAENFILIGPKKSLSYLLANKGYDVWIPNCRGTFHSRRHKTLDPDRDNDYWKFSWHEIGTYDLPAMIDHITATTNHSQIIYAGHSQGTTVFFVMASERPEYQSRVKLSISMGPSVFLTHTRHPILRAASRYYRYWHKLVNSLNQHEFIPFVSNDAVRGLGKFMCVNIKQICMNVVFMLIGGEPGQIDEATLPLIASTVPAGSSAMQTLHYAQEIITGEFKQYDFGKRENMLRYNSTKPPMYTLNVTTPVALFYSDNDLLNDSEDVEKLASILPNVVKLYKVPNPKFSHFDFLLAKNIIPLVYNEVLKLIDQYQDVIGENSVNK